MRLHKDDFEILKVIGRGAFGEVRLPDDLWLVRWLKVTKRKRGVFMCRQNKYRLLLCKAPEPWDFLPWLCVWDATLCRSGLEEAPPILLCSLRENGKGSDSRQTQEVNGKLLGTQTWWRRRRRDDQSLKQNLISVNVAGINSTTCDIIRGRVTEQIQVVSCVCCWFDRQMAKKSIKKQVSREKLWPCFCNLIGRKAPRTVGLEVVSVLKLDTAPPSSPYLSLWPRNNPGWRW